MAGTAAAGQLQLHTSWRDVLASDLVTASLATPPPPPPRPPPSSSCTWVLIVAHCLDAAALLLLAGIAALLRFGDIYLVWPPLTGVGGLCYDEAYRLPRRIPTIEVPDEAVYVLVIAAPIALVVLLELVLVFSLRKHLMRSHESGSTFFLKRCAKMLLVFLLGLSLTSLAADIVRVLVSRPRPYFLTTGDDGYGFGQYCSGKAENADEYLSREERDARLSFPSHRCSVLAFSGGLVLLHADLVLRRVRAGGIYVLRAFVLLVASLPALLLASQALDSRSNHWQDVVVGLLLGAVLAAYAVLVLGRDLADQLEAVSAPRGPGAEASGGRPVHTLPRLRPGVARAATGGRSSPAASIEAINTLGIHPFNGSVKGESFY